MAARNPRELFLYELSDIYDAERQLVETLPKLAEEAGDQRVRRAFEEHAGQTRHQLENLERCFEMLGAERMDVACAGIKGIRQERDTLKQQNPPTEVMVLFDLGAGAKVEHYEMASYKGLVDKASVMGELECGRLLHENLGQEEWMAAQVERLGREMAKERMEGEAGAGGRARAAD